MKVRNLFYGSQILCHWSFFRLTTEALQAKIGTLSLEAQQKLEQDMEKAEKKAEKKESEAKKKQQVSMEWFISIPTLSQNAGI